MNFVGGAYCFGRGQNGRPVFMDGIAAGKIRVPVGLKVLQEKWPQFRKKPSPEVLSTVDLKSSKDILSSSSKVNNSDSEMNVDELPEVLNISNPLTNESEPEPLIENFDEQNDSIPSNSVDPKVNVLPEVSNISNDPTNIDSKPEILSTNHVEPEILVNDNSMDIDNDVVILNDDNSIKYDNEAELIENMLVNCLKIKQEYIEEIDNLDVDQNCDVNLQVLADNWERVTLNANTRFYLSNVIRNDILRNNVNKWVVTSSTMAYVNKRTNDKNNIISVEAPGATLKEMLKVLMLELTCVENLKNVKLVVIGGVNNFLRGKQTVT